MVHIPEISVDSRVMGGKPCIRGTRVTVGSIVGQLGTGTTRERLLEMYPYITQEQVDACFREFENDLKDDALVSYDPERSRVRRLPF